MKSLWRVLTITVALFSGAWAVRGGPCCAAPFTAAPEAAVAVEEQAAALPKLVCLGAGKCMACKQMEPVREALATEYAGQLLVEFHDVWKNPDAGRQFGIRVIPTTLFFHADGRELYRQEGFMSKEDILAKWRELDIALTDPPAGEDEKSEESVAE